MCVYKGVCVRVKSRNAFGGKTKSYPRYKGLTTKMFHLLHIYLCPISKTTPMALQRQQKCKQNAIESFTRTLVVSVSALPSLS